KNHSPKQVYDDESPYMILAHFMVKEITRNNPSFKMPNTQKWSDDFRKIVELDGRDKKEVSNLIRWVQKDDFEMANVLSPDKLRKRYDNLLIKMKRDSIGVMAMAQPKPYVHDLTKGED
ncbi:MAG: hypothetical protein WED82_13665, partial [Balneolales bacterium]